MAHVCGDSMSSALVWDIIVQHHKRSWTRIRVLFYNVMTTEHRAINPPRNESGGFVKGFTVRDVCWLEEKLNYLGRRCFFAARAPAPAPVEGHLQ